MKMQTDLHPAIFLRIIGGQYMVGQNGVGEKEIMAPA